MEQMVDQAIESLSDLIHNTIIRDPTSHFEHHPHHMTAANNDTRVVHQATRECIKFCNLARIEADQIRKEQKLLKVFTTKCFSSFYLLFWCDLNLSKIYKIRST